MAENVEINKQYRLLDKELFDFHNKIVADYEYEAKPLIPIKEDLAVYERELAALKAKIDVLPHYDPVLGILQQHFYDFAQSHNAIIKKRFERPAEHITMFNKVFMKIVRKDSRPDDFRANLLIAVNSQADNIWNGILTWIDDVEYLYLKEFGYACKLYIETMRIEVVKIPQYFPAISQKQQENVIASIRTLCQKMSSWIAYTEKLIADKGFKSTMGTSETDTIPFEESYYRAILNDEYGVDLNELLSWYEEEINKTRACVFEIASKLKIPDPIPKTMKEVNAVLFKYAGACNSPEEMYKRENAYIKRTRAVAHEFVRFPNDEICRVREIPEYLRFSWPWGGYSGGCPRRRPLIGEEFLNQYNYASITDGWLKVNSIHEAYPGHHVQFLRTTLDPIPYTFKVGVKSIPLTEGTAHLSETAFKFIFEEDQFYPLFTAYRRHHTAVRVKSDLLLRYFGRPIGDAVKLYMDELDFGYKIARSQVKQQEEMQGYFTCYYYGVKKLEDWENRYGYNTKNYTELLFSPGRISLNNFERFLKLSNEERVHLLNDFGDK